MIKDNIKTYSLRKQIKSDPLKIFAVVEKTALTFALIVIMFLIMEKTGLTDKFLIGSIVSGTLGTLVIILKKMYYDDAVSELHLSSPLAIEVLNSALNSIGYTEVKPGLYSPSKKMFSFFYRCNSEMIKQASGDSCILIGPLSALFKLSKVIN